VLPHVGACQRPREKLVSTVLGSCWGFWPGFTSCLALASCGLVFCVGCPRAGDSYCLPSLASLCKTSIWTTYLRNAALFAIHD
jgi:hypothetical protein